MLWAHAHFSRCLHPSLKRTENKPLLKQLVVHFLDIVEIINHLCLNFLLMIDKSYNMEILKAENNKSSRSFYSEKIQDIKNLQHRLRNLRL